MPQSPHKAHRTARHAGVAPDEAVYVVLGGGSQAARRVHFPHRAAEAIIDVPAALAHRSALAVHLLQSVVAAVLRATRAGQVGRRVVQRSRRHVLVHLADERLAVVGVVGRDTVQCRRAAQAVCAVGVGGRAAAISARDQPVLAVPGVRSAPTRQGVAIGVARDRRSRPAVSRRTRQAVGGTIPL